MKNSLGKVIICAAAGLACYASSALATTGNPDESLLRNDNVQNHLKTNQGAQAKTAWNKLSPDQQANAKSKENARLHTIGSNHKSEYQNDQSSSTTQ